MMSIYAIKETSSKPTKCSICEESVKNPKQLPCDHKFCSGCINNQISRLSMLLGAQEKVSIVCPYCRDFFLTSVSFLQRGKNEKRKGKSGPQKLSFDMKTARVLGDRKAERCQSCSVGAHYEVAAFWCQNCSEYMCPTCAKYHGSMKMSKNHVVKTIRDKERYDHVSTKIYESKRPSSARIQHDDRQPCPRNGIRLYCEPCKYRKKTKFAKNICEVCSEQLCDDCSKCHRGMKMSKSHKLISVKDVISEQKSQYSLDIKCDKHYKEPLSLFCKYCQTSCCAVCAITDHSNCGTKQKTESNKKTSYKPKEIKSKDKTFYAWGDNSKDAKDSKKEKTTTFEIKPEIKVKDNKQAIANKQAATKSKIPEKKMEVRKGRLEVESVAENDWVISMALLSNGDILLLQLYDTRLKMMDSFGNLISDCSVYGNPWSVGVYNDSLAVVTFSDRKQLQLVNVSKSELKLGKLLNTRHKCLAVCFARNLIAATCWEGCVHLINISGQEIAAIDRDNTGQRLFTNPEYIAADKTGTNLYISDYKRHSVTGLRLLPNKIDNKPVFVFTHRDLEGPKGVTVDREGVVYISGMASRNLFRISPTGELIQIYRRRDDIDYYEDIAMSYNGDKLLVSAYEDNTIIVLRFRK
ncbi:uncharacterized protein LOC123527565 isoform X2 [Mercenaria mercenaria]|nr:uncharacterized protein LOC123527565 isoform X2 [Mercenaria mercenaria]